MALCTVVHQAPPSMGFSRQEYWNGLPCPPPGDLPDPGIEPMSLISPALAGRFFTTSTTWEAYHRIQQFHSWAYIWKNKQTNRKILSWKYTHTTFIAALFTIRKTTQVMEITQCPSPDEWIKKMWDIYIYLTSSLSIYEQWIITEPATCMDLEDFMLSGRGWLFLRNRRLRKPFFSCPS